MLQTNFCVWDDMERFEQKEMKKKIPIKKIGMIGYLIIFLSL